MKTIYTFIAVLTAMLCGSMGFGQCPVQINPVPDYIYCNGSTASAITFSSATPGATYAWTSTKDVGFGISSPASGNANSIPAFTAINTGTVPVTATVTVSVSANGCTGVPVSFTFTVNPTPSISSIPDYTYCNGATASAITFSSATPGTVFSWKSTADIGFDTSGKGSIPAFTATNNGTVPVTATVTVSTEANGCAGISQSFTVTVNPTAIVNPIQNSVYCNGSMASAIAFSSSTPDAVFTWTSTADVGFGTSGSSSIPSFMTANYGTSLITATVTVNASANGCSATPVSFTVTVQPTPMFTAVQGGSYCNGTTAAGIVFSSPTPNATFAWTSTRDVGFGASGTTSIPAFTAINNDTLPVTATVTAGIRANGCAGPTRLLTVTVNPTPVISSLLQDYTYCNGAAADPVVFSSPTPGASFSWMSTINIGFGVNGNGSIPAYTATNRGITPDTAMVTVRALANGCVGRDTSFSVIVNPSDSCASLPVTLVSFTGKRENNITQLRWQTANESNLKGFVVQRSADGVQFTTLGNVAATGSGGAKYAYTDAGAATGGKLYYRLVLTEADGKTTNSPVVMVDVAAGTLTMYVAPNPVGNSIVIHSAADLKDVLVSVTDMAGHTLYSGKKTVAAGGTITVDATRFAQGMYVVRVQNGVMNQVLKVIK